MMFFTFCIAFCFAFGMSSVSFAMVIEVREFQVAEVPPGSELCALDEPSASLSLNSVLDCALECQRSSYCENFNYNNVNNTCDIFFSRPKCYGTSPACIHYQVQSDQPYTGIPSENCSLPFTYGGRLYNGCAANLTGDGCNACLVANRSVALCVSTLSENNMAVFITVNVTIPTFNTSSLLMSINNWIVIQQRVDGNLSFNQSWSVYKAGFGDINKNFWLGLEKMHQLTTNAPYRLRIVMQSVDHGKWFLAEYDSFFITSESFGYALNVSGYVGDAGDALNSRVYFGAVYQNGMKFSTPDMDNDMYYSGGCSALYPSGFWMNQCFHTCLNCEYNSTSFNWMSLLGPGMATSVQLQRSLMMIKAI